MVLLQKKFPFTCTPDKDDLLFSSNFLLSTVLVSTVGITYFYSLNNITKLINLDSLCLSKSYNQPYTTLRQTHKGMKTPNSSTVIYCETKK